MRKQKNPYTRKVRRGFISFLKHVPQKEQFLKDLYPERCSDECTEFRVQQNLYESRREDYFKKYPFWYFLAKLLKRPEIK